MMKRLILMSAFVLLAATAAQAQTAEDREAVRRAALDYVESIYDVDPSKAERSVHPELVKRGFFKRSEDSGYSPHTMTFAELVELAGKYNKDGRVPKDAPKEVVVFDVADQTASAKVTASWGIDYLHLAKYEGRWQIINILWQTPPPSK